MKSIISKIGILGLMLAMPLSAFASNPPARPVLIYGSVMIDGALAPIGTKIVAQVENADIASFTLVEKGKYFMNISGDAASIGSVIKFKIGDKAVVDAAGNYKMVDTSRTSLIEYNLAIITNPSSGNNGGGGGGNNGGNSGNSNAATPATPAIPADPETDTPAVPAVPASDQNGKVKGETDASDGAIIQCKNSADPFAVYIVKVVGGKKFIRHIVSLQIFNHYKHLKWENLVQVESLDGFSLSGWVRVNTGANGAAGGGDRVWEINGDQTRHWIDMTAAEFLLHGGSDEAIYSINGGELGLYREGAAVKLK